MTTIGDEVLYCVYILKNASHTVLYTGVTSQLKARVYQHRQKMIPGFTARYNVHKLLYYEVFGDVTLPIAREKQIKGGSRRKKIALVESFNPRWVDLYDEI
jgi:putative endonuclease